jgi:hypothetical protein
MTALHLAAKDPPPAPGPYWTLTEIRRERVENHEVHITYSQRWLRWSGAEWNGDPGEPTYWHKEAE